MRAALLAVSLAVCGCGPIEYIAYVPFGAAGAVAEAKSAGAEKYAPYEMTAAQEYLHKARELGGYARYHSSVGFARKASKLAQDARKLAKEQGDLPTPDAERK